MRVTSPRALAPLSIEGRQVCGDGGGVTSLVCNERYRSTRSAAVRYCTKLRLLARRDGDPVIAAMIEITIPGLMRAVGRC
jgi:hypothetical protein